MTNKSSEEEKRPVPRPLAMLQPSVADIAMLRNQTSVSRVVPLNGDEVAGRSPSVASIPVIPSDAWTTPAIASPSRAIAHSSSRASLHNSMRQLLATRRVVGHGFSLPIIFSLSVAIGVSYSLAALTPQTTDWQPQDLTGENEWTSTTRTHLVHDPRVFLTDLFRTSSIGEDTTVTSDFLRKYKNATERNVSSTIETFDSKWLEASFILQNGIALAGTMAGAFEGYAMWPCSVALPLFPTLLTPVCPQPATGWFMVEIFNNRVAMASEKASTYLALDYTAMGIMSARIWAVSPPVLTPTGIIIKGYEEGTHPERVVSLLKTEEGVLALAKVEACDRSTQSNAKECDRLEAENVFVRNIATRDFVPPNKMDKIKIYGSGYAMGNFEAAGKTFVMLPAVAIVTTNTGYSAITRYSTIIPFRITISNGKVKTESNVYQVASYTPAVGNGFAAATAQMVIVCLIVYNAVAHCHAAEACVKRENRIFGFKNHITMGIIARRLGTYKFVAIQLCVYHALNVGKYFSAVYYGTQKFTDTLSFAAEGFLLVVVCSMLLDQLLFFEKYSSVRETLTVLSSSLLYLVFLYIQSTCLLSIHQVQVTELKVCAGANQCIVVDGYELYYVGLVVVMLLPAIVVNGPIHKWVIPTRSHVPSTPVDRDQFTSFEKFCLGIDARREFGSFSRESGTTPISIVHAAGFTYVGPYLVRIKDYYMVVLARHLPPLVVESCGLTLTVFKLRDGRVVSGQHMTLIAAQEVFREARHEQYAAIR